MSPQMTPLDLAKRVTRASKVERRWGKASILSVLDSRLTDSAHRLLCLLSAVGMNAPEVSLSYEEIAWAFGCSKRQAIRWMTELVNLKYVTVTKRHNSINVYRIPFLAEAKPTAEGQPKLVCAKCGKDRKVNKACYCAPCAKGIHPKVFQAIDRKVERQIGGLISQPKKRIA